MQFGKTNTCFTRSKSIGLNDFLIRSNALNIWISDCHVTKSRSLTTPILHEYINKWQSYLITTPNETNFIYSSLKPQTGKQKNSFCSSVLELKVGAIVTSWVINFFYSYYNCYYELHELCPHISYYLEPTIIHKIVATNSSFHVKQRTTGKVQFLFFRRFFASILNIYTVT